MVRGKQRTLRSAKSFPSYPEGRLSLSGEETGPPLSSTSKSQGPLGSEVGDTRKRAFPERRNGEIGVGQLEEISHREKKTSTKVTSENKHKKIQNKSLRIKTT